MTTWIKTQSPLRGNIPSIQALEDLREPIRTSPYYPGVRAARREKVLHPVLTSAQNLDPIPESRELHVRLHPALANAQSSVLPQDKKGLVPHPLFGAPNSRRYPRVISSDANIDRKESSMYTPPLMTMLIAEIDAEITALSSSSKPTVRRDHFNEQDLPILPKSHDKRRNEQDPTMLERTESIDRELSATSRRMRDMRQRGEHKKASAKVSINNFKELAATVASARIQAFLASAEYLAYQNDQKAICREPHRKDTRERVANFEKSPMWQKYVEDVSLVLEQGNLQEIDSIAAFGPAMKPGVSDAPSMKANEAPRIPPPLRRKEARTQL